MWLSQHTFVFKAKRLKKIKSISVHRKDEKSRWPSPWVPQCLELSRWEWRSEKEGKAQLWGKSVTRKVRCPKTLRKLCFNEEWAMNCEKCWFSSPKVSNVLKKQLLITNFLNKRLNLKMPNIAIKLIASKQFSKAKLRMLIIHVNIWQNVSDAIQMFSTIQLEP